MIILDDKRNLGVVILAFAMVVLIAADLFLPWGHNAIIGTNQTYVLTDKILMFIAILIMYISLVLVFISYQGDDKDYLSGLYILVIVTSLLASLSYDISYGILLLMIIALVFILLIITKMTKQYYLLIAVVAIIIATLLQQGLYV